LRRSSEISNISARNNIWSDGKAMTWHMTHGSMSQNSMHLT
jgi:hypothetical protein